VKQATNTPAIDFAATDNGFRFFKVEPLEWEEDVGEYGTQSGVCPTPEAGVRRA
jgi:hypothetical protein